MDRLIYTAMTGASQSLDQQAVVANNLANASTTGFRAQLATYRAVPMNFGDGSNVDPTTTRTYVLASTPGADYAPRPITPTGNPLDVALPRAGRPAAPAAADSEGYTRARHLHAAETAPRQPPHNHPGPRTTPAGALPTPA
ncbi:flagellar biosynthesis protein FlgF, partial [Burkholderia contaminans]